MLSSKDIRNVKFSKSMGGYKQEEVDILLDKIEVDYEQFDRTVRELNEKIEQLTSELETQKSSQSSIQNVLISAQRLADQIVDEAKQKSEQIVKNAETSIEIITAREKELTEAFDRKANDRKAAVQKEIDDMLAAADKKSAAIDRATADSVKRQQILFDKLKLEISAFKAEITKSYKEHLEILQKIPDEVPMNPETIRDAVAAAIDKAPDAGKFIESNSIDMASVSELEEEVKADAAEPQKESGFVINSDLAE